MSLIVEEGEREALLRRLQDSVAFHPDDPSLRFDLVCSLIQFIISFVILK